MTVDLRWPLRWRLRWRLRLSSRLSSRWRLRLSLRWRKACAQRFGQHHRARPEPEPSVYRSQTLRLVFYGLKAVKQRAHKRPTGGEQRPRTQPPQPGRIRHGGLRGRAAVQDGGEMQLCHDRNYPGP